MFEILKNLKTFQLLLVIIFISCTVPDDSLVQETTTESQETTTESQETTTDAPPTTNSNIVNLEDIEITFFYGNELSELAKNILLENMNYAVENLFSYPGVKFQNLQPILIVQLDNNYESAIKLETEYCEYIEKNNNNYLRNSKCSRDLNSDGSRNIFTDNWPYNSSISSNPFNYESCCYLLTMQPYELPNQEKSLRMTSIHETFHIFQISNYADLTTNQKKQHKISGKISGDGDEHKPWWMEGNAVFFQHLYHARSLNDIGIIKQTMRPSLFSCYCGDEGLDTIINRFLNNEIKLYNYTWAIDQQLAYEMGSWFTAYLVNFHGEEKILDFWINTQTGILFEDNFLEMFGKDYRTYVDEFENFLRNNDEETIMSILPTN